MRLYLMPSVTIGKNYLGYTYSPSSGLFRNFAELEPQQDQILDFASQWGMLTAGSWIALKNKATGAGEPLDVWKTEIADLSLAVRVWDLITTEDTTGLGQYFRWQDTSGVLFELPNHRGGRWIAARETNPALLETLPVGDLIRPAWYQLQHILNNKLDGHVSARLLWNTSHTRLSLYQVPKDLISALWLQLARAIDGDRKYLQCEECRNWFEVSSPDGGRKDKRYCSTACRARDWRKTKKGGK